MNLIYFSIGNDERYINILNLNLKTLELYFDDTFELLFIVDNKLASSLKKTIKTNIPYDILVIESMSMEESSINKLKIHKFHKLKNYEKVIYCDCDILWCNNPKILFDMIRVNRLLVSNELHHGELMSHRYWSGSLLEDFEKIEIQKKGIRGINGGFFAFESKSVHIIEDIFNLCNENLKNLNECIEQPFINVHLYRNKNYDVVLSGTVSHDGYNIDKPNEETIIHFAGGPGSYLHKMNKMSSFYKKNLEI